MRNPQQIKDALDDKDIVNATYLLLEPLINKVYMMGYVDACNLHTGKKVNY